MQTTSLTVCNVQSQRSTGHSTLCPYCLPQSASCCRTPISGSSESPVYAVFSPSVHEYFPAAIHAHRFLQADGQGGGRKRGERGSLLSTLATLEPLPTGSCRTAPACIFGRPNRSPLRIHPTMLTDSACRAHTWVRPYEFVQRCWTSCRTCVLYTG